MYLNMVCGMFVSVSLSIKSTPNHIHHHCATCITPTHTTHIISSTSPTYASCCPLGFVDRPRWSDGNAGQMDGEDVCAISNDFLLVSLVSNQVSLEEVCLPSFEMLTLVASCLDDPFIVLHSLVKSVFWI